MAPTQLSPLHGRPMERRSWPRRARRAPIRVCYAECDEWFELDSSDVSGDGVFLHSDLLIGVGETLRLEISVPGRARPMVMPGRVVRVDTSFPCGMAIKLGALSAEERRALDRC